MNQDANIRFKKWRLYCIVLILLLIVVALIVRMAYLTIVEQSFLNEQGDARSLRVISIPAYRGMILDRNGKPLAISTPVDSVWMNPKQFKATQPQIQSLGGLLGISGSSLSALYQKNQTKSFVYLARSLPPEKAADVAALNIPGVYLQQAFRRYYPYGAATAHVLGFTNIDDKGIAGLEAAYNTTLQGEPGKELVQQDRYGHVIEVLKLIKAQKPGKNVQLSIDERIQFLAYRVLKNTVKKFKAVSGSAVVLNVKTGEVLAMTNLPSFNPNDLKKQNKDGSFRNRAVTDVYEPGSVMKAFAIINALDSGKFTPDQKINTHPGVLYLGRHVVKDENVDHGILTVTQVLQKSSNVGVTKMTLDLPPDSLWQVLHRFGFGQKTQSNFPGERAGSLVNHRRWAPIMLATLAFGYGMTATPLQIARAYAAIANQGELLPISFEKLAASPEGKKVVSQAVAQETMQMLHSVVSKAGTGYLASVPGYQVAGKTGTAKIAKPGGYSHQHIATFVSIAPVSDPQLVVVVVIHKPQGKLYYAAYLAAPATAKIMAGALQMLNITPDDMASYRKDSENSDKKQRTWVAPV